MPLKQSQPATEFEEIDRWDHGVGWLAHPQEKMQRASHALEVDGDVWLVDPVDAPELDDLLAEFGEVAGVVVLLNRHYRDADEIARRHDVPVYVPSWFDRVQNLRAPLKRVEDTLPDTDYRVIEVVDSLGWEEAALYDDEAGTLVVAEAVGTAPYYTTKRERLGVHPMLRVVPPKALRGLRPERIVVGHGRGVSADAASVLADTLRSARRRTPELLVHNVRLFLGER